MYPGPLITPSLVRQKMEETLNGHGAKGPLPDEYWYQSQAPKPRRLWNFWRRPKAKLNPSSF